MTINKISTDSHEEICIYKKYTTYTIAPIPLLSLVDGPGPGDTPTRENEIAFIQTYATILLLNLQDVYINCSRTIEINTN